MKVLIYVLGLLYCFLCLLLRNPSRRLLAFLGFIFVIHVGWVFYRYTGIFIYDFPILTLVFLGFFSGKSFKWYFKGLSLPALLFFFWSLLTTVVAKNPGWTLAEASKILRGYLAFLAVANHVRSRKDVETLLLGFFVGVVFESLIGIYQWLIGPAPLWFLNVKDDPWRSTGTFYVPHFLANYLIMFLPISLRLFIFYRESRVEWTLFYGVTSALGIVALFATYARGAWLAFVAGMGVMFLFSLVQSRFMPRVKWAMGIALIGGVVFFMRYLDPIKAQFGEGRRGAVEARYKQYEVAKRMIIGLPIMGTGLGNYGLVSPDFLTPYERSLPDVAERTYMVHNSYLYYTAQTGLIGGFFMLWGIVLLFRTAFKGLRSKSLYFANLTIGIFCGFVAIAVAFLFGPDIHLEQFQVQFGMMTGLMLALQRIERSYFFQRRRQHLSMMPS